MGFLILDIWRIQEKFVPFVYPMYADHSFFGMDVVSCLFHMVRQWIKRSSSGQLVVGILSIRCQETPTQQ